MTKMYMRQVSSCGGKIKLDALSRIEENLYKALHRMNHFSLVLTVVVRGLYKLKYYLLDSCWKALLPNAKAVVCASMSVLHGLGMMKFKYEYENMLAGILRIGITLHRFLMLAWYKCEAGWSHDLAY
ncbi:hypothetical protein OUZ56_020704 [Daphnia magna]|uniref:Uncharacterized protein n=1 Tax=Daphnia magna TaxID=35525 RepID=A0ABQ9ZF73_9CRUS|nr:hypothetical protein OUZ56_020704 [Daphnia magna]